MFRIIQIAFYTFFCLWAVSAQADHYSKEEASKIGEQFIHDLEAAGVLDESLDVGERAPDFTLPNMDGERVRLYDIVKENHVILVFYRGEWCPVCSEQLHQLQQVMPKIEAQQAEIVAVSPQMPEHSKVQAVKNDISYEVLSDLGSVVADEYGLVFTLPEKVRHVYEQYGIYLEEYNGDDEFRLPVPAVFILRKGDGAVMYAYKNVDYKKRAAPGEILAVLRDINQDQSQ